MRIITDRAALMSVLQKVGWFGGLWLGGVLTVGVVAMAVRAVLHTGH